MGTLYTLPKRAMDGTRWRIGYTSVLGVSMGFLVLEFFIL